MDLELVHSLFRYEDGQLIRLVSKGGYIAGSIAGALQPDGYYTVRVKRKTYPVHRVIFAMLYGYVPDQVDHIDGNRGNNRIENLRAATAITNGYNRKNSINNTSGTKGVTWHISNKKWQVRINVDGKRKALGYYNDLEMAELVAVEARNKYHGEYANHG